MTVGIGELSNFSASAEAKIEHVSFFFLDNLEKNCIVYGYTGKLRTQLRKGFCGQSDPPSGQFFLVSVESA